MREQPEFPYRVEFNLEVPIARAEGALFDITRVEILRASSGEPEGIASATVYRIRAGEPGDYEFAAKELGESEFLVDVCATALDPATGACLDVYRDTLQTVGGDPLILDRIEFVSTSDDTAVLRGLLARCVLDTMGRGDEILFLPTKGVDQREIWERALGAASVGNFLIASAARRRPAFPLEVV